MRTTIKSLIDVMKPKRRPGAVAKVTPCPYCGVNMKQADHTTHRPICKTADFAQDPGGGYNADGTFPQT